MSFLAPRPVRSIWGVGTALATKLEADGVHTNADLREHDVNELVKRYGRIGRRLHELAHGIDKRRVNPDQPVKSISSETTFDEDLTDRDRLVGHLWRLAVKTSDRAKSKSIGGLGVTLKLKTADFRTVTRQTRLPEPSNTAEMIFHAAEPMLLRELAAGPFRLIGVGLGTLTGLDDQTPAPALFDDAHAANERVEAATDKIRGRFGKDAIQRGRALR